MKLACCVSADDLAEVQADFCRQLVEDYRLKAERLLEIARRRAEGAGEDVEAEYSTRLLKAQEDAGEILRQAKEQAARILANAEKAAAAAKPASGAGATKAA